VTEEYGHIAEYMDNVMSQSRNWFRTVVITNNSDQEAASSAARSGIPQAFHVYYRECQPAGLCRPYELRDAIVGNSSKRNFGSADLQVAGGDIGTRQSGRIQR